MNTIVGTMKYIPPGTGLNKNNDVIAAKLISCKELFAKQNYNYKCDIWSLGVLIFVTLSGSYPFM